jgi:hypothetical protein
VFASAAFVVAVAPFVAAVLAVVVFVAAVAFVFALEAFCANAAADHVTDPNDTAATPAIMRARALLIVSICRSPIFNGVQSNRFSRQFFDVLCAEI